ncbi:hypothetical protein AVEN_220217-1 [Araneus ventricosus]|uniref:Uncharacterized protein n=1 Tax=Araneus ventricosus TaxID=182803 RepID=A0A4Y2VW71_ARAVE|nr:hypothetical protein AVEN_220217-1 [Araneus ventricosus]
MLDSWQMAWDDGDTGSSFTVIPKASTTNQLDATSFVFTAHGPFPSRFLKDSSLAESLFCCSRGGVYIIHYATVCLLTILYHMAPPSNIY